MKNMSSPSTPAPPFPYFLPVEPRALTALERAIVERITSQLDAEYRAQVPDLQVVGRCGCGNCPRIFFQPDVDGARYYDLVSFAGRDDAEGLVGVVLMESDGKLAQLDFFSVDDHEPWSVPDAESLAPF